MMPAVPAASRVDVVIVTAGGVERTLECVRRANDELIATTVVVENATSKEAAAAIAQAAPHVEVVYLTADRGLSAAFNRGAERGSAPLVLFLNDDTFATEYAVARLVEALDREPAAVSAVGRLIGRDGKTQTEYLPMPFPTLGSFVSHFLGIDSLWPSNPWRVDRRRPGDEERTQEIEHAPGACLLVRRSALAQVGGWDERFWYWFEDVDLSRRLVRLGPILYVPTASFEHIGGATAQKLDAGEIRARLAHGLLQYTQAHFSRPKQIVLAVLVLAAGLVRLRRSVPGLALSLALGRPLRHPGR
jgi:N-acetylglucosaminyl-diphospho-decaprenol L-rhamnosyltransferase